MRHLLSTTLLYVLETSAVIRVKMHTHRLHAERVQLPHDTLIAAGANNSWMKTTAKQMHCFLGLSIVNLKRTASVYVALTGSQRNCIFTSYSFLNILSTSFRQFRYIIPKSIRFGLLWDII